MAIYTIDNLHPNDNGAKYIASRVTRYIKQTGI